mmetsp:Transcript_87428/g.155059  ORF Transcript_87428/g.155059 Transcript_87428/m.155059 type:complete len:370 (+) Transcript_87428:73-1182(+)
MEIFVDLRGLGLQSSFRLAWEDNMQQSQALSLIWKLSETILSGVASDPSQEKNLQEIQIHMEKLKLFQRKIQEQAPVASASELIQRKLMADAKNHRGGIAKTTSFAADARSMRTSMSKDGSCNIMSTHSSSSKKASFASDVELMRLAADALREQESSEDEDEDEKLSPGSSMVPTNTASASASVVVKRSPAEAPGQRIEKVRGEEGEEEGASSEEEDAAQMPPSRSNNCTNKDLVSASKEIFQIPELVKIMADLHDATNDSSEDHEEQDTAQQEGLQSKVRAAHGRKYLSSSTTLPAGFRMQTINESDQDGGVELDMGSSIFATQKHGGSEEESPPASPSSSRTLPPIFGGSLSDIMKQGRSWTQRQRP